MNKAATQALEDLKICLAKGWNYRWHGRRALANLPPGVDPKRVERAMRIVLPNSATVISRVHDSYLPIAARVIAKLDTPQAVVLRSYDGELREIATWLATVVGLTPKSLAKRLRPLCNNTRAVAAARAAVVAHGVDAGNLIMILAHDGEPESLDALVDVVDRALAKRDASLDTLRTLFVPYAKLARMKALAAEFTAAIEDRGSKSALLARFATKRLVLDVAFDSREVRTGLTRKASAWIVLQSHALPNAAASISWNLMNHLSTRWEDGTTIRDENKLGAPKSVDDIPAWLARSARKLKIRWDPTPPFITSSLRGKARAAALAWLLGG